MSREEFEEDFRACLALHHAALGCYTSRSMADTLSEMSNKHNDQFIDKYSPNDPILPPIRVSSSPLMNEGYFPPPWDIQENEEKTKGWIAFQDAMREDPDYYRFKDEPR